MIIYQQSTQWLEADWPAPAKVTAVVSTRSGTMSAPPYEGFNTAQHVGADAGEVSRCRKLFMQRFQILRQPQWLNQVHGTDVVAAQSDGCERQADGVFTRQTGMVCTIHTADCLPVFFCDSAGSQVALAHAGWRGLLAGILERTLDTFSAPADQILCWLGPAISQAYFEVGPEVKDNFQQAQPVPANAFIPSGRRSEAGRHYYCDLFGLATARLKNCGISQVYGGRYCTYSDPRFFSYRRDKITGRLLSAIWIRPSV